MWIELKKICKRDCIYVFFCTTKFGYKLIQSNERWFRYDLVWEKSRKVGFLSANKMPLRKHEMVYVFKDKQGTYHPQKTEGEPYKRNRKNETNIYGENIKLINGENKSGDRHPTSILQFPNDFEYQNNSNHEMVYVFADANDDDLENNRNLGLREYFKSVMQFINKTLKEITNECGRCAEHCFYINSTQFGLPTEKTYNKLIEKYNLRDMPGFREYKSLKDEWEKILQGTYNPQKTEGKPYKTNGKGNVECYNTKRTSNNNKGDRHPTSILQFPNDFEYQNNSNHEMVYIFADANDEENKPLDFNQNIRDYARDIKRYIKKPTKDIINDVNNTGVSHFFTNGHQFRMILEKDYNKLIEKYNLRDMPGFREYKSLKDEWGELTYNPQKTEGKPYKIKGNKLKNESIYGGKDVPDHGNKTGDRHPTSILQFPNDFEYQNNSSHEMVYVFKDKQGTYNPQKTEGKPYKHSGIRSSNLIYGGGLKCSNQEKTDRHPSTILKFSNPKKSLHRTAKPVDLCEWLIKTYSNEGELVLDFTMGSGSTGIACLNTGRGFIGIEKDPDIFKVARHRLFKNELCQILKNDQ
jgi:DNA modification methylase